LYLLKTLDNVHSLHSYSSRHPANLYLVNTLIIMYVVFFVEVFATVELFDHPHQGSARSLHP